MAIGFTSINDGGITQIDETYRNLRYVASGRWGLGAGASVGTDGGIDFPAQTTGAPLIFVRPISDGTYCTMYALENARALVIANGDFDWVVYGLDNTSISSNSTHGVQVFDAAGSVVFDSRYEVPRIKACSLLNTSAKAYPYTINFAGWGVRPWFLLNSTFFDYSDDGRCIAFRTNGTSQIVVDCIWNLSYSGYYLCRGTGTGTSYVQPIANPGGPLPVAVMQR